MLNLKSVHTAVTGRLKNVMFRADTGDAMGMNMLSKVNILCTMPAIFFLILVAYQF